MLALLPQGWQSQHGSRVAVSALLVECLHQQRGKEFSDDVDAEEEVQSYLLWFFVCFAIH